MKCTPRCIIYMGKRYAVKRAGDACYEIARTKRNGITNCTPHAVAAKKNKGAAEIDKVASAVARLLDEAQPASRS